MNTHCTLPFEFSTQGGDYSFGADKRKADTSPGITSQTSHQESHLNRQEVAIEGEQSPGGASQGS